MGRYKKGTLPAWEELNAEGNELTLWITSRYQGEVWFAKLAKRWGTSSRMIRFFVRGERKLSAEVLYLISVDTEITMEHLLEQNTRIRRIR